MHLRKISLVIGITLVVLLCVGILGLVGYTGYLRITYPYELSPFEGFFVDSALQVASGGSIYDEPTDIYISMIYTPISYYLSAVMISAGVEHGFLASRLVSVFGVICATLIAMCLVLRTSSRKWLCLLVPPLVAAQYFHTGTHFDQVRPDNLMVLFVLASVAATTIRSNVTTVLACAVFTLLAIFTKQSAVMFYVAFFPAMLVLRRRPAIYCLLLVLTLGLATLWIANAATDGWFIDYTIKSPSFHGLIHRGLLHGITQELLDEFSILTTAIALTACYVILSPTITIPEAGTKNHSFLIVLSAASAAIFYSAIGKWNQGGASNIHVTYAVIGAAFMPALIDWTLNLMPTVKAHALAKGVIIVVVGFLILSGFEHPGRYIPRQVDVKRWVQIRETMSTFGPQERLWFPCHGSVMGDTIVDPRRPCSAALAEYVGGFFGKSTGREFPEALLDRIESKYFTAILLPTNGGDIQTRIMPFYQPSPTHNTVTLPHLSGFTPANEVIWIPR